MQQLELISCVTLLTQSKTFSIGGVLYRYSHKTESVLYAQYFFEPLPQQRKTATLKLSRDRVLLRCYEVPSLRNQHHAKISGDSIQQSLF